MILLDQLVKFLGRNTASVLLFHKVPSLPDSMVPTEPDIKQFESVLDVVMERFRIVPLSHIADGLRINKLPPNSACITFDDGYSDWLNGVIPVLIRRNIHATFFLTTSQFDGVPMWHERVNHAIRYINNVVLNIPDYGISLPTRSDAEKHGTILALHKELKHQSLNDRNAVLKLIEKTCEVEFEGLPRMTDVDLRAINSKGFSIGAHTVNHPILTHATDVEAMTEIGKCREILEGLIGAPVESFAYPNGRPGTDFLAKHIKMVRQAGYRYAVTTQQDVVHADCSLFQIPRFTPWGPDKFRMLTQILRNQISPKLNLDEL